MVEVVVGLILSYVVSHILGVPFIWGIGIVGLVWFLARGSSGGSIMTGATKAVRGTFGFVYRLAVGLLVFV